MELRSLSLSSLVLSSICLCVMPAFAQSSVEMGKLKIHVEPKQAYVFVDGKAVRDGSQTMELAAGSHKIGVYNYGYLPRTQDVQITAGKTTPVDVALQASGEKVTGPFADIEFKGHPRAAVLLNGKTPDYFVGHVDEFDWNWIWHQRLLVKPGTYNVTITREGSTIWSGAVTAKAGEQVTVDLNNNGVMKTKTWKEGLNMGPQPRFHAGIASATVPIAPVSAQISAQSTQVGCGQPTMLKWASTDAADTSISNLGEVPRDGDRSVSPLHNTTYSLKAKGPGGEVTRSVTVDVNGHPTASLTVSNAEVHYHKIGDKVVEQDAAVLHWSADNANSVRVEPLGSDAMTGSQTVKADPAQTADGPVNENMTYTLTATNACGQTTTKTAMLHIVGSIDPPPATTLASVFYPTAYPPRHHPKVGLLNSEQMALANAATEFKTYSLYDKNASLIVVGHTDVRGSEKYNTALSERRSKLVKSFLVAKGIPADRIKTQAERKDQQISLHTVKTLQAKDEAKSVKWMTKHEKATWLAYNRRADILLEPAGTTSEKIYPVEAAHVRILWQRPEPSLKKVEMASKESSSVQQQASLGRAGK